MALTREQSLIWQAMNIGPQWILRDSEDPLFERAPAAADLGVPNAQSPIVPAGRSAQSPLPSSRPSPVPANRQETSVRRTPRVTSRVQVSAPVKTAAAVKPRVDEKIVEALKTATWEQIAELVKSCHACPMSAERTRTVCADGQPGCPLVIVGEAPGRDEDIEGVPFVGKSGQLLTKILSAAGLTRGKDVAIVNVLKCRPPRNRDPQPEEMDACSAFLDRQLALLEPKAILLMGRFAVERILGRTESISRLREQVFKAQINGREVPCIVTYHPSYLLRSPVEKQKSWHDVLRARNLLKDQVGA